MNILIINHYAGGPQLGMEHRPFYMASAWSGMGHNVRIISASFAHTRIKQPDIGCDFFESDTDTVSYTWLRTPRYTGNKVGRIKNMLTFIFKLRWYAKKIERLYKPDIVIASSTYPLDIFPANKIAQLSGAKLIYEVHDLWPLSPIELGGYSKYHPYILLLQIAEKFAYKKSDKVVSLLPHTLEHMVKHGMDAGKFVYVPNGIVPEEWDTGLDVPDEHQNVIDNLRENYELIIGYAGAHGVANALDPLIETATLVKDLPVAFVLAGNGPEKERLIEKADNAGLENIRFLETVPKPMLPALLDQMDILYVGFKNQSLYRFGVSPNKIFDYMMSGKPVIQGIKASNNPVAEAKCGLAIEPENPVAIEKAIRKMIVMPKKKLIQMGDAGRKYVLENHDYKTLARRFIDAL